MKAVLLFLSINKSLVDPPQGHMDKLYRDKIGSMKQSGAYINVGSSEILQIFIYQTKIFLNYTSDLQ